MINSIGLQNPGLEKFITEIAPELKKLRTTIIANVCGSTVEEYVKIALRLTEVEAVNEAFLLKYNLKNLAELKAYLHHTQA